MADPSKFRLSNQPEKPNCAVQDNSDTRPSRTKDPAMLTFIISFFQRKKGFTWSPAVDLSDPFVAAALAPMTHS